jgi:flagellar motor switch protein FliG
MATRKTLKDTKKKAVVKDVEEKDNSDTMDKMSLAADVAQKEWKALKSVDKTTVKAFLLKNYTKAGWKKLARIMSDLPHTKEPKNKE